MKQALILIVLLTAACGGREPDYVSRAGAEYYFEPGSWHWEPEHIEYTEQILRHKLSKLSDYPIDKMRRATNGVKVHIYKDRLPCKYDINGCLGLALHGTIKMMYEPCALQSALPHELAHIYQQALYNFVDYEHAEQDVWDMVDEVWEMGCGDF